MPRRSPASSRTGQCPYGRITAATGCRPYVCRGSAPPLAGLYSKPESIGRRKADSKADSPSWPYPSVRALSSSGRGRGEARHAGTKLRPTVFIVKTRRVAGAFCGAELRLRVPGFVPALSLRIAHPAISVQCHQMPQFRFPYGRITPDAGGGAAPFVAISS